MAEWLERRAVIRDRKVSRPNAQPEAAFGLGVWGLGFGVWGLGFGVWGLRFGVWGMGGGVWGLGFGVWGLGFGVWGLGFGVWGLGFRVWGMEFRTSGFGLMVYSIGFRPDLQASSLCQEPYGVCVPCGVHLQEYKNPRTLQGYLAHNKTPPPRTVQEGGA